MSTKEVEVLKRRFGRLMSILHRQSQVYINYSLREFDITSAEYSFLLYLYKKDRATQDELSSYLYINKAATARAIKSLEQKGYVVKEKDNNDKRFNRICLTDRAKKHEDEIINRIRRWSDFLTEDIDRETIDIILTVLEKMVDKVERTNLKKAMEEI